MDSLCSVSDREINDQGKDIMPSGGQALVLGAATIKPERFKTRLVLVRPIRAGQAISIVITLLPAVILVTLLAAV